MPRTHLLFTPAVLLVAASGFVACGDDDDDGGATTVDVKLNEFVITADPDSAPAGDVDFSVENIGEETHEFVIVETGLAPDALPTAEDGSVDEEGEGITEVDEIEDIESGATAELSTSLEAGSYVLFCNIVEDVDGEIESHYQEGMHTGFTVD